MPMTLEEFTKQVQKKIQIFNDWALENQLFGKITPDHFGYKCSSSEEFEQMRKLLEHNSAFIYQSIISKRRIAIIKLKDPIKTNFGHLFFFELSDQKPDGSQRSGFDHLEFFPKDGSEQDLIKYLEIKNIQIKKVERPHHTTHDIALSDNFIVRIESRSLIEKIIGEEIGFNI